MGREQHGVERGLALGEPEVGEARRLEGREGVGFAARGSEQGFVECLEAGLDRRGHERVAIREVQVERRGGDTGAAGDRPDGEQRRVPDLVQDLGRGLHELLTEAPALASGVACAGR